MSSSKCYVSQCFQSIDLSVCLVIAVSNPAPLLMLQGSQLVCDVTAIGESSSVCDVDALRGDWDCTVILYGDGGVFTEP